MSRVGFSHRPSSLGTHKIFFRTIEPQVNPVLSSATVCCRMWPVHSLLSSHRTSGHKIYDSQNESAISQGEDLGLRPWIPIVMSACFCCSPFVISQGCPNHGRVDTGSKHNGRANVNGILNSGVCHDVVRHFISGYICNNIEKRMS